MKLHLMAGNSLKRITFYAQNTMLIIFLFNLLKPTEGSALLNVK